MLRAKGNFDARNRPIEANDLLAEAAARNRNRWWMIVSQMLTLFTTPVIYLYLDRFRLRMRQLGGKARRQSPGGELADLKH